VVSPGPVDKNLAEVYVPLDEESFLAVGMSDLLFNDLSQLSIYSSTKLGMVAFHKLVLQMTHFAVLLKSFIKLSFESKSHLEAYILTVYISDNDIRAHSAFMHLHLW